ncbi:putative bifunctional diguanylate cyclase/phosphodiesterase [Thiomicrorhabdus aquaedulcis]|uniref:putative bifunctional diguanylate cyclase/phosphodiesterase n=1 Tax=Thiomicrorhabdus aquaedulcis TaxID=2211106 RepID=UPI001E4864A3|nr:GGDEF domain-containing phosphodiesterase [Thiomicrorhabdus aquaedulcis]
MFKKLARVSYVKTVFWAFVFILPFAYIQNSVIQSDSGLVGWLIPLFASVFLGVAWGWIYERNEQHQREKLLFKAVADFSLEFVSLRTVEGVYQYVSPAVLSITGYQPEDFYQTPSFMDSIIYKDDCQAWLSHSHHMNDDGAPEKVEFRVVKRDGEVRWLEHLCGTVRDPSGHVIGVRSINIDITERKLAEHQLEHLGLFDPLTDLPNRRYLSDYMQKLIAQNSTYFDELTIHGEHAGEFAVLFIDLDRFKYVNDAYGHSIGDALLQEVAGRFKHSCLEVEQAMIARFGGDEFVLVTQQSTSSAALQGCVLRINQLLEAPFRIEGHRLSIGATAGIAVYPRDGVTPEALIQHADAAMFKAKSQGLSMAFFAHEMAEHATEMVDMQTRLRAALKTDCIKPYYQPLIELKSGQMVGAEVLARWILPDGSHGPSPGVFIPVSEETGLIGAVSETLMAQAGADIAKWQALGVDIKFSINVSARQFADEVFCERAIEQFERLGVDLARVQIELTESVLLNNVERSLEKIELLKSRGFSIALDDFGTGFSSLHYLTLFPFDTLKIDRAFVIDIIDDKRQFAIAKAMIHLAHDLSMTVVAEGIETDEQRQVLSDLGCDVGQGYWFSRPICPEALSEFIVINQRDMTMTRPGKKV